MQDHRGGASQQLPNGGELGPKQGGSGGEILGINLIHTLAYAEWESWVSDEGRLRFPQARVIPHLGLVTVPYARTSTWGTAVRVSKAEAGQRLSLAFVTPHHEGLVGRLRRLVSARR